LQFRLVLARGCESLDVNDLLTACLREGVE